MLEIGPSSPPLSPPAEFGGHTTGIHTTSQLPSYESLAQQNNFASKAAVSSSPVSSTDVKLDVSERVSSPNDGSLLAPPLPMKKSPSPNESVSSMTPSEQEILLSRSEDESMQLEETESPEYILNHREQGDGHEQPEEVHLDVNDVDVEDSFHPLDDGGYEYEVEGLPDGDPDDEFYPMAKPPTRVRFSSKPMKVRFYSYSAVL